MKQRCVLCDGGCAGKTRPLIVVYASKNLLHSHHFIRTLVFRLESTLNYGMERGWSLGTQKGLNHVALGYDEGCVLIQLGREEPAMSMDSSGKILWAKHAEIQQVII